MSQSFCSFVVSFCTCKWSAQPVHQEACNEHIRKARWVSSSGGAFTKLLRVIDIVGALEYSRCECCKPQCDRHVHQCMHEAVQPSHFTIFVSVGWPMLPAPLAKHISLPAPCFLASAAPCNASTAPLMYQNTNQGPCLGVSHRVEDRRLLSGYHSFPPLPL